MAQASETRKVRLNTGVVGNLLGPNGRVLSNYSYGKGDEIEMKADEAERYVRAGYAAFVPSK